MNKKFFTAYLVQSSLLDLSTAIKYDKKLWLTASVRYLNSVSVFPTIPFLAKFFGSETWVEVSGVLGHLQLQIVLLSLRCMLLACLKMCLPLGLCDVSPWYHRSPDTSAGPSLSCAVVFSSHLLRVNTSDLPVSSDGPWAHWNGALYARLDPSNISLFPV